MAKPAIPALSDLSILRYVYVGEPSRSRILTWNTRKKCGNGFRATLGFAFWSAGAERPVCVCEDLYTVSPYDLDETLATVLAYMVSNCQSTLMESALVWSRTPEARALELDLAVCDDSKDYSHLFFEIER